MTEFFHKNSVYFLCFLQEFLILVTFGGAGRRNGKNKNPHLGILISGGPGRTVYPHVRFHSMGPIRYVRFKLRIRLFSPTDAPNRLGLRPTQAKIKIPIWGF